MGDQEAEVEAMKGASGLSWDQILATGLVISAMRHERACAIYGVEIERLAQAAMASIEATDPEPRVRDSWWWVLELTVARIVGDQEHFDEVFRERPVEPLGLLAGLVDCLAALQFNVSRHENVEPVFAGELLLMPDEVVEGVLGKQKEAP
jgi:hypothetical protein